MNRKEIREAITLIKGEDPQENFNIIEYHKDKIIVEILWEKDRTETLIIKLK